MSSGKKTEPVSHGVPPEEAAEIGLQRECDEPESVHSTRGFKAPPISSGVHPCGSQGRH